MYDPSSAMVRPRPLHRRALLLPVLSDRGPSVLIFAGVSVLLCHGVGECAGVLPLPGTTLPGR